MTSESVCGKNLSMEKSKEPPIDTVVSYLNDNLSFKWELPACLFSSTKKEKFFKVDESSSCLKDLALSERD